MNISDKAIKAAMSTYSIVANVHIVALDKDAMRAAIETAVAENVDHES